MVVRAGGAPAYRRALELKPTFADAWSNLGLALSRQGYFAEALAAYRHAIAFRADLAMAHWKLNQKVEARNWYDKAVQWMDKNDPKNEALRRFRAEAAQVLGVNRKKY